MLKNILRKAWFVLVNPELALEETRAEQRSWLQWPLYLVLFSIFSAPFITIKSRFGFGASDWHFSGSAFADAVKNDFPYFEKLWGTFWASVAIVPLIWLKMILMVLLFSLLIWLVAKYLMKGTGTYYTTCAGFAYTFLPSLLFGALPYSGILSATWTSILQLIAMPMVVHQIPVRKAMWFYIVFLAYAIYCIDFRGTIV